MKQTKKGVREIALDILESVEKNQSYSNLLLNNLIKKHQLSGRGQRFAYRNKLRYHTAEDDFGLLFEPVY